MRERLAAAADIARRAGEVLLRHYGHVAGEHKGDQTLVTIADREAERLVRSELGRRFPDDCVIGEEFGRSGTDPDARAWYVDPLDGTTNFVYGLPLWGVSLGLLDHGRAAVGAIHYPLLRETYYGAEGLGAWRNDEPLRPWPGREPFRTNDPVMVPTEMVAEGLQFGVPVRVRTVGSAALQFAFVASGAARCGLWRGDYGWDLAGGLAICRAAGVQVLTTAGAEPDWSVLVSGQPMPWDLCAAPADTMPLLLAALRQSGVRG